MFTCIYSYYLAKYGYNIEGKKKVFVGPYIFKRKDKIDLIKETNNQAMISFGIETHEHIIPKQEGGEENTGGIPTLTGKILTPEKTDNPSADPESDKLPSVSSLSNLKNLASATATQAVSQTTQTAQTQLEKQMNL